MMEIDLETEAPPLQDSKTTFDFDQFKLEGHVRLALSHLSPRPKKLYVDATDWLLAAASLGETSGGTAFSRLRALLARSITSAVEKEREGTLRVPLSPALMRSLQIARPYLGEVGIWGRDYAMVGLLADEPGLERLARENGMSLGELRQKWLDFVQSSDERRPARLWRKWFRDATTEEAGKPSGAVSIDLSSVELTQGAQRILRAAVAGTEGSTSTADLLIAMVECGRPVEEPEWVGDFMRRYVALELTFGDEAERHKGRSLGERMSRSGDIVLVSLTMAAETIDCLERASDIAVETTGRRVIAGRHLLAALIAPDDESSRTQALEFLDRAGPDLKDLRQDLAAWVQGQGDNDEAWRGILVLGTARRPRSRAEFHADLTTGPDLLDVEPEVQALATLIAARESNPPLSIGLFGDWGSGKSFFMRKVSAAVAALSRGARTSGRMQRDVPFFKHVVQIEFNAWHYVEGNLWASLVEHILRNLGEAGGSHGTATDSLQEHWIEQLGFAEQARAVADSELVRARRVAKQAEQDVHAAREELATATTAFAAIATAESLKNFILDGPTEVIRQAIQPLGLDVVGPKAADLIQTISSARRLLQRGNAAMTPLMRAPDRAARWVWLAAALAGPVVATPLVGHFMEGLAGEFTAGISAFATAAAGTIATVTGWLQRQVAWTSKQLSAVEDAQKSYDDALRQHLARFEAEKVGKEQQLSVARQKVGEAERLALEARQRESQAEADLKAATTSRLLGEYIQDRAASSDYRKHLGVLAVIRQDFEKLSRLIEEENWRLSPDEQSAEGFRSLEKIESLEAEQIDAKNRINRIVLYVDDLDRCPPAKVVEVLEAVHLLLAFPLFVVVVGVDARWITKSLQTRYRDLMGEGEEIFESSSKASPRSHDYLEKIFQIPLWLKPLRDVNTRRMLRSLIGPRTSEHDSERPRLPADRVDAAKASEVTLDAPVRGALVLGTSNPALPREPISDEPSTFQTLAESLQIHDDEAALIESLAPLLGRSPRAVKRFVNVYRLIKAGLTRSELAAFRRQEPNQIAPYAAVLMLLAVDTGEPMVSRELYKVLDETGVPVVGFDGLCDELKSHGKSLYVAELVGWIKDQFEDSASLQQLHAWRPRVERYSFQAPLSRV